MAEDSSQIQPDFLIKVLSLVWTQHVSWLVKFKAFYVVKHKGYVSFLAVAYCYICFHLQSELHAVIVVLVSLSHMVWKRQASIRNKEDCSFFP